MGMAIASGKRAARLYTQALRGVRKKGFPYVSLPGGRKMATEGSGRLFSLRKMTDEGFGHLFSLRKMTPEGFGDLFPLRKMTDEGFGHLFPLRKMTNEGSGHLFPLREMTPEGFGQLFPEQKHPPGGGDQDFRKPDVPALGAWLRNKQRYNNKPHKNMASNAIPESLDAVISLGRDAKAGATSIGAAVGLVHNTAADINTDLTNLIGDPDEVPPKVGSQEPYIAAKAARTAATAALDTAVAAGFKIIATTVDVLKYYLGRQWNSAWNAVGFTNGSLAMPEDPVPTLMEIRGYLLVEGERQIVEQNVTAAAAQSAANAITTARAVSNTSKVTLATTKATRDGHWTALYDRLSGLLSELDGLLGPDDPRWYAFGFSRPADGEGPGPISTLTVDPVGPGALVAVWTHALRSEWSRVFVKIVGTDPEPVQVASEVEGLTYTLLALPSGETVEVFIVPANESGDGKASPTVSIVVP